MRTGRQPIRSPQTPRPAGGTLPRCRPVGRHIADDQSLSVRERPGKGTDMQAISLRDRDAGIGGLALTDMPYPHAAENDVIVRVHAAGFTPCETDSPTPWPARAEN